MEEKKNLVEKIDKIILKAMWIVSIVSGICLAITAVLCTSDALLSKFLNTSIPNGTEWITYLNIPVVFCAIAYIQVERGHTSVDLLAAKIPAGIQKVIKIIGDVMGCFVCYLAGFCAVRLTMEKLANMTKSSSSANAFVIWPFAMFIAIGFVTVGIAFTWSIIKDASAGRR